MKQSLEGVNHAKIQHDLHFCVIVFSNTKMYKIFDGGAILGYLAHTQ